MILSRILAAAMGGLLSLLRRLLDVGQSDSNDEPTALIGRGQIAGETVWVAWVRSEKATWIGEILQTPRSSTLT